MIVTKEFFLSKFRLAQINLATNDALSIVLKNPLYSQHVSKNNMVVSGSLQIQIAEYSEVVQAGGNAKFCPRKGQTPFPVDTVVTMTALEPTQYLCLVDTTGATVNFETVSYSAQWAPEAGCVATPITAYTLNGVECAAGAPYLTAQGDTLVLDNGALIGLFTAV